MALLSNFSAAMLDANTRSAGLEGFFDEHLSTDRAGAYKPDPRAYQLGLDHFSLNRNEIVFAAFGGWDAAGAKAFGYPVYWCNRQNQLPEELGVLPDINEPSLANLTKFIATRNASTASNF
jgi:2-haloacid dehalogenase